jgi:hypothetical protein
MAGERPCHFCGDPVNPDSRETWQATSCFSRSGRTRAGGSRGGTDRVEYRRLEIFACAFCIDRLKAGRLGQESLL